MQKITEGQRIKPTDREGLLDFADDVQNCNETLLAMGKLSEVSNQQTLVKIIEKLPLYLINRWRTQAHRISKRYGKTTFSDIVQFIRDAAEEANDPVYGKIADIAKDKITTNKREFVKKSSQRGSYGFSTQVGQKYQNNVKPPNNDFNYNKPHRTCYMCGSNHTLFGCDELKKMTPSERYKFVHEKRLCNNCLLPGHYAAKCYRETTCSVPGCG